MRPLLERCSLCVLRPPPPNFGGPPMGAPRRWPLATPGLGFKGLRSPVARQSPKACFLLHACMHSVHPQTKQPSKYSASSARGDGLPAGFPNGTEEPAAAAAAEWNGSSSSSSSSSSPSSSNCSSNSRSSSGRAWKGPLNVVQRAEEGDILRGLQVGPLTWAGEGSIRLRLQRWGFEKIFFFPRLLPGQKVTLRVEGVCPRRGNCRAALLGTEAPAPGHRLPPCPHFAEGCSGCQLLHLASPHQLKAKQHLLQQLLQELLSQQQQQQQQQEQQEEEEKVANLWRFGKLERLVSEAHFAGRGDFLLRIEGEKAVLGLPDAGSSSSSSSSSSGCVDLKNCLRLAAPLQEVYRYLRDLLLPMVESRKLRVLDPRSNAGTLSGVTLRLAEGSSPDDAQVLLRLRGQLEEAARPALLLLAERLASRCPSLTAVTFQDIRRSAQTACCCLCSAVGVVVFLRCLSGGTRLPFSGLKKAMSCIFAAVEEAAGMAACRRRLWTAFESGGFFGLLLAKHFQQITAFAAGCTDAEETRQNFALNGLQKAEVVECADSPNVAVALAERGGSRKGRRALHAGRRCSELLTAAIAGSEETGKSEAADVLLLTPSRGGLPKVG
ncbi:hypothetical protein Efla_000734 [Eimeria flavescens]